MLGQKSENLQNPSRDSLEKLGATRQRKSHLQILRPEGKNGPGTRVPRPGKPALA